MNRRVLAIALALMLIVGIAGYPVTALAEDEIWYTVSISVTGNGGVWMNGDKFTSSLELKENATGTIDIIPDTGYEVTHVYVDGVDQGRVRSYTFYNVQGNHSLKVVFSRIITDEISDSVLRSKIRRALGNKPSDYAITEEDMLSLTVLDAQYIYGAEITDISGLQYAENLEELYLSGNEISDITHLAGLTKLKKLSLHNNNTLSDISPIAGLTNLTDLDLYNTPVSDISALSNLKKMKFLQIYSNSISDISPLSQMSDLHYLEAGGNKIRDISKLANLTNLTHIGLGRNNISDISALKTLVDNAANPSSINIFLSENYLNLANGTKTKENIDYMVGKGVAVLYDSQKSLSQTPFDAKAQAGATRVDLSWDYMPDTEYEVTRTGGEKTVTLLTGSTDTSYTDTGVLPGIEYEYTVRAHIWVGEGVDPVTVEKKVAATTGNPDLTAEIKDNNLREAILTQLGRGSGPITFADMLSITSLSARFKDITDLSGLEYAVNLEELDLWGNRVSDISPLAGLTKLRKLDLGSNFYVSDISALASLTDLEDLKLYVNDISDISPLAGLTKLKTLALSNNKISGISALSSLTNLTTLALGDNDISDISALSSLTNLENLHLYGNKLSDISALAPLTKLENLNLGSNELSDISALAPLKKLTQLSLGGNHISDISVLSSLTKLESLGLEENEISDISALAALKNLKSVNLGYNKIRDITPLAGLTQLYSLGLQHNNISDISVLETVTAGHEYDTLYLYNNYLNLTEGSRTMDTISVVKDRVSGWFVFSTQKPLAETPFDAKAQSKGIGRVELSWDYMPDTVYEVTRTGGGETKAIPVGSESTSYIDTDVIPGTEYSYTVKAHIWVGDDVEPVTVQKTVTVKAHGRTLSDSATGIRVSGDISEGAALVVEDLTLGDSPADAAIRARMKDGGYVFIWGGNISLTGSFTGTLALSLPVGDKYNGQTVVVMHAKQDGSLETYDAVVRDGYATIEVASLSPFAVFRKAGTDDIPKTGDGSAPWVWWLLGGVSAAGVCLLSLRGRKVNLG